MRVAARARLFAATLGALALTLVLTIGIGAVLTRRQVDHVAGRRPRAPGRRPRPSARGRRQLRQPRHALAERPRDRRAAALRSRRTCRTSTARVTARRRTTASSYLYSYRTLPSRGLLAAPAAERASRGVASVPARPAALGARRSRACGRALVCARTLDRAADATRRRGERRSLATEPPRAAAGRGAARARLARAVVQRDGRAARRLTRERAQLPALGQPRAEDAADRDSRLRRRAGRGRVHAERRRARFSSRRGGSSASFATCSISRG